MRRQGIAGIALLAIFPMLVFVVPSVGTAPGSGAVTASAITARAGWQPGPGFPGAAGGDQPVLLSCASAASCVGVDQQLQRTWVLQARMWRTGAFGADGQGVPTAISCAAPGICLGADAQGDILTFAHGRWSVRTGPSVQGGGPMSCSTPTKCLFVNGVGQWFTWDGQHASKPRVAYPSLANTMGSGIYALSCAPRIFFCAAADSLGALGTFRSGRWGPLFTKVAKPPIGIGCYSPRACLAAFRPATDAARSKFGTWAMWDGKTWSLHTGGEEGYPRVPASAGLMSCSARGCTVLVRSGGSVKSYLWTAPGSTAPNWGPPLALGRLAAPELLACAAPGPCTAVEPGRGPKRPGRTWQLS